MLQWLIFLIVIFAFLIITIPTENFATLNCEKYKPMELQPVCTDLHGRFIWKVINPNPVDIPFTWKYLVINKGSGVALKKSSTTFVAPRAGVCTIKYRLGNKDYSDTEVFNLKICR